MNTQDYLAQKETGNLYFWYGARTGQIDNLLKSKLNGYKSDRKILDIGCGTGTELDVLKKYGQVTALDIDNKALDIIKKLNCQIIKGNIENIELDNNSFDCICCFDILEHLEKDEAVLQKIYSALKPGGYIFISSPAFQFLYSTHDKYSGHVRRYSRKELQMKLINSNFSEINLYFWNFLLFFPIAFIRIFKKILLLALLKTNKLETDAKPLHPLLNSLFYQILNFENTLSKIKIFPPFGLTIFASAKK